MLYWSIAFYYSNIPSRKISCKKNKPPTENCIETIIIFDHVHIQHVRLYVWPRIKMGIRGLSHNDEWIRKNDTQILLLYHLSVCARFVWKYFSWLNFVWANLNPHFHSQPLILTSFWKCVFFYDIQRIIHRFLRIFWMQIVEMHNIYKADECQSATTLKYGISIISIKAWT